MHLSAESDRADAGEPVADLIDAVAYGRDDGLRVSLVPP